MDTYKRIRSIIIWKNTWLPVSKKIEKWREAQTLQTFVGRISKRIELTTTSHRNKCVFILRLNSEGWLLDVFQRVHSDETAFFVPFDLEISNQELSYIMKKAEQWRGINGERRKVSSIEKFCREIVIWWPTYMLCFRGYKV